MLETYTAEVNKAYIPSQLDGVHPTERWRGRLHGGYRCGPAAFGPAVHHRALRGREDPYTPVEVSDQLAQSYQELLQSASASLMDITGQEGQMTWLVYITAARIGGRISFARTESRKATELWHHDPVCTTPVLKLIAGLVPNRSQWLQFDVSSPSGILTLGEVPKHLVYVPKQKDILPLTMLEDALCARYVNFRIFHLCGDDVVDNALQTSNKLLFSISHSDLQDYPKLSESL
ncbi:Exportin-7 [Fukomys damarensis]|uniref:Exportin-7 n=1 Tax=Fukomys damarensis TaxID=885580 RepID=A0A091CLB1_FUKDA|nr:Exportin-7 [Fukomys damarensis]